jgi:arylformamidase
MAPGMDQRSPRLVNAPWIDVSPVLSPATAVWPGDTPLGIAWADRVERGGSSNLSTLTLTPHLGAHVDAPLHLFAGGADVAALDLAIFIGPATVVDLTGRAAGGTPAIDARAIDARAIAGLDLRGSERILFRTRSGPAPGAFSPRYAHLTPEAADLLVAARVRIVGIDAPSVDAADAADLPAHWRLLGGGVVILEGLELDAVAAGRYELIALPLRFAGVEASPVRAVVRPLGPSVDRGGRSALRSSHRR